MKKFSICLTILLVMTLSACSVQDTLDGKVDAAKERANQATEDAKQKLEEKADEAIQAAKDKANEAKNDALESVRDELYEKVDQEIDDLKDSTEL